MTLFEVLVASALLAATASAAAVLLRTAHSVWLAHDRDVRQLEAAHAALRHVLRECRQAQAVAALSSSGDQAGWLQLVTSGGAAAAYRFDSASEAIYFGQPAADELLAPEMAGLRFGGYRADGLTPTSVPGEIQLLRCEVSYPLPREAGGNRTIGGWAWLRCR